MIIHHMTLADIYTLEAFFGFPDWTDLLYEGLDKTQSFVQNMENGNSEIRP